MCECSEQVSFFINATRRLKLFIKHPPWYDIFISYILSFFVTIQQRSEANDCENTSFVQLEPWMIVPNKENPYLS